MINRWKKFSCAIHWVPRRASLAPISDAKAAFTLGGPPPGNRQLPAGATQVKARPPFVQCSAGRHSPNARRTPDGLTYTNFYINNLESIGWVRNHRGDVRQKFCFRQPRSVLQRLRGECTAMTRHSTRARTKKPPPHGRKLSINDYARFPVLAMAVHAGTAVQETILRPRKRCKPHRILGSFLPGGSSECRIRQASSAVHASFALNRQGRRPRDWTFPLNSLVPVVECNVPSLKRLFKQVNLPSPDDCQRAHRTPAIEFGKNDVVVARHVARAGCVCPVQAWVATAPGSNPGREIHLCRIQKCVRGWKHAVEHEKLDLTSLATIYRLIIARAAEKFSRSSHTQRNHTCSSRNPRFLSCFLEWMTSRKFIMSQRMQSS